MGQRPEWRLQVDLVICFLESFHASFGQGMGSRVAKQASSDSQGFWALYLYLGLKTYSILDVEWRRVALYADLGLWCWKLDSVIMAVSLRLEVRVYLVS